MDANDREKRLLENCVSELRVAAWSGMERDAREPFDAFLADYTPGWCRQAAAAFDAMEALGQDPTIFVSCRALRPWAGPVER